MNMNITPPPVTTGPEELVPSRYAVRVGLTSLTPPFDGRRREAGAGLAASLSHSAFPGN